MTVTNKYSSVYNGIAFVVNERRTDSYDEGSNGQTFSMNYELQAEESIDLDTARAMAVMFISAESLFTREGNPVSRFSIEHENEEDLDMQWVFSLEWSASSSSGDNPTITPWPQIPYTENESNGETSEGVDVIRPAFSFTLQKKMTDAELNTVGEDGYSYKQRVVLLTGTVNDNVFKGWSAGCVLFEGCSASAAAEYHDEDAIPDGEGGYVIPPRVIHTITYKFKCNLTRNALPVAGITVRKEGFQYLWVYSKKQDDSVTGVTLEYPQTVVVNDVYEKTNFALLELT